VTKIEAFLEHKYINLETYKKNGEHVRTPVWFVILDGLIYVVTREKTGKVKRIKNRHDVRIVPCTFNGKTVGMWVAGQANFIKGEEAQKAIHLRKIKYGLIVLIANFLTSRKGNLIVISIKLN
jgi:PPOX class probable F420-dependent enzyme